MASPVHGLVRRWFAASRRPLPWRDPATNPWGILVSEVMCQQTPAERAAPAWLDWMARWPAPAALAAAEPGEVIRAWGRLGYPRRALRLHEAAAVIADEHDGIVPSTEPSLRSLPGVGDYTAAAVAAFAFGQRSVVLDTNVRRVLARFAGGEALPGPSITTAERARALAWLPRIGRVAAEWSAGLMELGAVACRSARPQCAACPIADHCAWRQEGFPAYAGTRRRSQRFEGTDRQARGRLLAVMREAPGSVASSALEAAWDDRAQRQRAVDGLVADGLIEPVGAGRWRLPQRR